MGTHRSRPARSAPGTGPRARLGTLAVLLASALVACDEGDPAPALPADEGVPFAGAASDAPDDGDRAPDGEEPGGPSATGGGASADEGVPFGEAAADADAPPAGEGVFLPRSDVRGIDALRPYRADGPWAPVLAGCALAEEIEDACTLEVLPFVAQSTPTPSVDDVMDRVLVTHDWMGERFEEALERAPDGLVQLFAATTSIAIGSTVRPSFYTGLTGGVRLDPEYLWQNVTEKATVSIDEDYRAPFRALLDFRDVQVRFVGTEPAFRYFPLDDRTERTFEDAQRLLLTLLYHELAHANDFLPPGTAGLLDPTLVPAEALYANRSLWLSPQLQGQYPQESALLARLAEVRYRGETPTEGEAAIDAATAGAEFANDGALDFYAYASIREDFAELFEAAMMKAIFDVDVHVAFTSQPPDPEDYGCEDLAVGWGSLRRLGDPSVARRAGWAVASIYGPGAALDAFVAGQSGTAAPMVPGTDFCTNLRDGLGIEAAGRRSRGAPHASALPTALPWEPMSDAERHALARGGAGR